MAKKFFYILNIVKEILIIVVISIVVYVIINSYLQTKNTHILVEKKLEKLEQINEIILAIDQHNQSALAEIENLKHQNERLFLKNKENINGIKKFISADTNNVNAVLRYWTDRLYKLRGLSEDTTESQ